ncbi:MAG TPA: hypothetical protein V6C65_40810 [Allocoleopsis sp.]
MSAVESKDARDLFYFAINNKEVIEHIRRYVDRQEPVEAWDWQGTIPWITQRAIELYKAQHCSSDWQPAVGVKKDLYLQLEGFLTRLRNEKQFQLQIESYKKLWQDNPLEEGEKELMRHAIESLDALLECIFSEDNVLQNARDLIAQVLGEGKYIGE